MRSGRGGRLRGAERPAPVLLVRPGAGGRKLFLVNGNRVFAVEPNKEMREVSERRLGGYASFTSVAGTAETTTLEDHSMGFVVVGQAFHWFDPGAARTEFVRILSSMGE